MDTTVIVLGATGMLGHVLVKAFRNIYQCQVVPVTRKEFDASKRTTLLNIKKWVKAQASTYTNRLVIVNAMGVIKPRIATSGVNGALMVNSLLPRLLADAAEEANVPFIHVTTDCVYDGKDGQYSALSQANMTDDYGWSKWAGEPHNALVVRTSIIGEEEGTQRSLVEWLRQQKGKSINGFTNHRWNGVTCLQLAHSIMQLIAKPWSFRTVHLHSPDSVMKFELCSMINEVYQWNIAINPMAAAHACDRTIRGTPVSMGLRQQIQEMHQFHQNNLRGNPHPSVHVVTLTGIRPDFIRMAKVFQRLDDHPLVKHTMIHSGQHYDTKLSGTFFEELKLRDPDFNLKVGAPGHDHVIQHADLCTSLVKTLRGLPKVDLVLFLGDSNSVLASAVVKKAGFAVGHIEAGMRSYDSRMLEETNRIVCDHASSILFAYHENYKEHLVREGIDANKIHVVGNTIVEMVSTISASRCKLPLILVDIHRPENFKDSARMKNIALMVQHLQKSWPETKVEWINFHYEKPDTPPEITWIEKMGYREYCEKVANCLMLISDSGTAQEEAHILQTPVVVPRDFTERPESMKAGASMMVDVGTEVSTAGIKDILNWVDSYDAPDQSWLGDGNTSRRIVEHIVQSF